jgi:hypothetical protein
MPKLALSLLAIVSLPVCAADLRFNFSGDALPFGTSGTPNIPFDVVFDLNTLGGTTSSFSFSFPPQCLTGWSFAGASGAIVSATVGGKAVLQPGGFANASGDGGSLFPQCVLEVGSMQLGPLFWTEIITQNTAPLKLNPQDPLGDLFLHSLCHLEGETGRVGCYIGSLQTGPNEGWDLGISSVKITALPVLEPGFLGLMLLGLTATTLRMRQARTRHWDNVQGDVHSAPNRFCRAGFRRCEST